MQHSPATDFQAAASFAPAFGPQTGSLIGDRTAPPDEEPLGNLARRLTAILRKTSLRVIHGRTIDNISARFFWIGRWRSLITFGFRFGPAVKEARGIGLCRQFLDMYRLIRRGVSPKAYHGLQLYDLPEGIDAAERYLGRFETKNGIYALLKDPRAEVQAAAISIRDKHQFAQRCRQLGLPTPQILALIHDGAWTALDARPGALDRDIFVKPIRSKGAIGAAAFTYIAPGRHLDSDGRVLTRDQLMVLLARMSRRKPVMVMPLVRNHFEIADLADQSAITFRVFTCFNAALAPVVTHGMLRVLGKLEPDWDTIEEYGAAIDLKTGRLGPICGDIDYRPHCRGPMHPHTGAQVEGRVVAHWPAIAELARLAHRAFPLHMLIGWDIVLTPDGPMLLEGNVKPDTHFLQRVHQQFIGDSILAPLLRYHLAQGEKLLLRG